MSLTKSDLEVEDPVLANPAGSPEQGNMYTLLGEEAGCRRLAEAFYAGVVQDAVLRAVYGPSYHCAVDGLTNFFVQFFGGPCVYSESRWYLSLREAHQRFKIGVAERDAWMQNMVRALDDLQIVESAQSILIGVFSEASMLMINQSSEGGSSAAGQCRYGMEPLDRLSLDGVQREVTESWSALCLLEEIVGAVRREDVDEALDLTESDAARQYFVRDQASLLHLFAVMCSNANSALLDYVCGRLEGDPELVQVQYGSGRTLLHDTAAEGCLRVVKLLLQLGADPNARNRAGHDPLYFVGNHSKVERSNGEVVRALVEGGAEVKGVDPGKLCTALHMAARRGNTVIGKALLECGADIEARDRDGDTPLRRAVNCGKTAMVGLLLAQNADPLAVGSRGLTPVDAARGSAMKRLFNPMLKWLLRRSHDV